MRTTVVDVTVLLARKMLEGDAQNRDISDRTVQKYAMIMLAGKWKLTHQGVAFSDEETVSKTGEKRELLIDGQHRL